MVSTVWIPAFAGMTGKQGGNGGERRREWRGKKAGMDGVNLKRRSAAARPQKSAFQEKSARNE